MVLEKIVNKEVNEMKAKKVLVYGDVHFPYHDEKALYVLYEYMKDYKPDIVVINGDVADFYGISQFDKNPDHFNLAEEIKLTREHFKEVREINKNAEIYYLGDNHCSGRLQKFIYKNPDLFGLEELKLEYLFRFSEYGIKYIGTEVDYWKREDGILELGDTIVFHGDAKINGAQTSKYSGQSAKNTMLYVLHKNVVMNHVHRLAIVLHTTTDRVIYGLEAGCLCRLIPNANWQQGFVTFEIYKGKMVNPELHHINKGVLYDDGKIYKKG